MTRCCGYRTYGHESANSKDMFLMVPIIQVEKKAAEQYNNGVIVSHDGWGNMAKLLHKIRRRLRG